MSLLILVCGVYGSVYNKVEDSYVEDIEKLRINYNHYLKYEDSPLEMEELEKFRELDYFKVNKKYRIRSNFEVLNEKDTFYVKRSNDEGITFLKYGLATFSFQGRPQQLIVLKEILTKDNKLFIPFKDRTTGRVTYGAGRYLDVIYEGKNEIHIDFNLAYNPYCAYNSNYKCPKVPEENVLNEEIRAGEKSFSLSASN